MTERDRATHGPDPSSTAALAFAVAGVVTEGAGAARLRWRAEGEGYAPGRVAAGTVVAIDDGVALRFAMPGGEVDFLLLEPAAIAGTCRIEALSLDGAVVPDLGRRVIAARGRVEEAPLHAGVQVCSGDARPAVEVDVRGLVADGGGHTVELVVRREPDAVVAARALSGVLERLAADREAGAVEAGRAERRLASVEARLEAAAQAIDALESGIDQLEVAGAGRERKLDALQGGVAALSGLAGGLATQQEVAAIAGSLAEADARLAAMREDAQRDGDDIRRSIEALRTEVERLASGIENAFWRRWLRRLSGGAR